MDAGINLTKIISHWWLVLASGILFTVMGIWILSFPLEYYLSISVLYAVLITLSGILELIFTTTSIKRLRGWGWYLAGSLADIIVGAYLVIFPLVAMVLLPVLLGFAILFKGVTAIIQSAYGYKRFQGRPDWPLLIGIFMVLMAFVIILNPIVGELGFVAWTALAFILSGVFRIILAIRLQRFNKLVIPARK